MFFCVVGINVVCFLSSGSTWLQLEVRLTVSPSSSHTAPTCRSPMLQVSSRPGSASGPPGRRSETVSLSSSAGFNPLHLAAKNNQLECCRKLLQVPSHHLPVLPSGAATFWCSLFALQSKSPVDAADVSGRTALHHAGEQHDSALGRVSPFCPSDCPRLSPASGGHTQVVQLLCELRSSVNLRDAVGVPPAWFRLLSRRVCV